MSRLIDRHLLTFKLPLAVLGSLLLQAGGALWWAAQQGSTIRYHDVRLEAIDMQLADTKLRAVQLDRQVLERLARVEERQQAQLSILTDLKSDLRKFH